MAGLELFTTRVLDPGRRRTFWRDLIAETFPGMEVDAPPEIRADLARWSIGRLSMARAASGRARVTRAGQLHGERMLVFHLQRHGQMALRQKGLECFAVAGDILIAEQEVPYAIDISDGNDCLIVQVPVTDLSTLTTHRNWHAQRLDGRDPNVALLGGVLSTIWADRRQLDGLDDGFDQVLIGMAGIACARGRARIDGHSHDPIQFALSHLHNPELTTGVIAQATGLSARAVQNAFTRMVGCSPTRFVADQRLQRAAQALRAHEDRTVTQIAFDAGFSDAAFFARCFRRHFGVTPSQWRRSS